MSRYIPFTMRWDNAPLDISYVFENEKPAGCHGFVKIEGDKFVFEDGTVGRFFGTLFNSGMNFCSHERSKTGAVLTAEGAEFARYAAELVSKNDFILKRYKSTEEGPRLCVSTQHYDFIADVFCRMVTETKNICTMRC